LLAFATEAQALQLDTVLSSMASYNEIRETKRCSSEAKRNHSTF
jgi:hypothetical protein